MTYQVLARKWRPRDFPSLVGQDHVVRALTHALDQQRLHHAYLFTGTRGVGKTTLSRILAKALNCETGITSSPCGVCRACQEIDAGRFVDYVEMDAASNRGVDEMAALLERAIYAPVDARFKVYMIDEVHMLTNHAFNAMLKTLEEPPAHVKFILATTDPQKIPVTVLSRCLQFNLKQMPAGEIVTHLDRVLLAEGIAFEPQALRLLSRAADGSMRDALSLTDQAIAYAAGTVSEEAVRGMLGALDQHYLMRLLDGIVASNGAAVLAVADEMASRSLSFSIALQDLAQLLNRIGWAQFAPDSVLEEWPEAAEIRRFAQSLSPEQVQLYYQIATIGRSELGLAPDEYAGFTMTLLRMLAFRPFASAGNIGSGVTGAGSAPAPNIPAASSVPPMPRQVASSATSATSAGASVALAKAASLAPVSTPSAPSAPVALQPKPSLVESEDQLLVDAFGDAPAAPSASAAGSARKPSPAQAALAALGVRSAQAASARKSRLEEKVEQPKKAETADVRSERNVDQEMLSAAKAPARPALTRSASAAATQDDPSVWGGAPWDEDDGAAAFLSSAGLAAAPASKPVVDAAPASNRAKVLDDVNLSSDLPPAILLGELGFEGDWPSLAAELDVKGLAQQLAYQSELVAVTATSVRIQVPVAQLASGPHVEKVRAALAERLGRDQIELHIEMGSAKRTAAAVESARKAEQLRRAELSIQQDPFIQALLREFDASILPGSTQALTPKTDSEKRSN